jgi:hypothetical protein
VHANFERKVVDPFVYHKHCKFHGHFRLVLTLQLDL